MEPASTAEPDPLNVLRALGWEADARPARVTVGWDTLLWRFVSARKPYALRLYRRFGESGSMEARAQSEALAMVGARAVGLPVPRIEARGSYQGVPVFILEWRRGERMLDHAQKRPWRIARLAYNFGRAQARIHSAPPPDGLVRYDAAWIRQNVTHRALAEAVIADADFTTLCHLDYHPLNVLVRGTKISGLLDFSAAAVTDRRADLARTKSALLAVPLPHDWKRYVFDPLRKLVAREWEKGYLREAGSFPLTPTYEALGIWLHFQEIEEAVADGRGWVDERDLAPLRAYRDARLRAAGLPEDG
jgi:aminoglycoside phosphotransferase (APT) family kinase protein